jgi:hypothetical protein
MSSTKLSAAVDKSITCFTAGDLTGFTNWDPVTPPPIEEETK